MHLQLRTALNGKEQAPRLNGASATFKCAKFIDLVEEAAWAAAAKPGASAQTYRAVAGEFLGVLELLASRDPVPLHPWVYLAAQTLECILKAYIAKLRLPMATRRNGEDLISLWRAAVNASAAATKKITIALQPPDWCVMLDVFHDSPYLERYHDVYALAVKTDKAELAGELRTMLTEVEAAFR